LNKLALWKQNKIVGLLLMIVKLSVDL